MTLTPFNFERRLLARFGSSKNDANGGKAKLLRITKLNKEAKSFVRYSHIGSHVVHFTQLLEGGIHIRLREAA